jgi:predicted O-methyltransferase YrrM
MDLETSDNLLQIISQYNLSVNDPLPITIPGTDRVTLARLFNQLGYRVGAEIGVERGLYAETLCREIPGVKLYGVDIWDIYAGYPDHQGEFYQEADERLRHYNVELVCKMSMDAVLDFEDESLDFVYIDANHMPPWITDDIREWSKKVRSGGIISGHDYVSVHIDAMRAIDDYTQANHIRPWFVMGDTILPNTDAPDKVGSYLWVKP